MCISWLRDKLTIELEEPTEFAEPLDRIRARLATRDPQQAAELLQHGHDLYSRTIETSASVERRATTLLGTVAIAASLTIAGGSLLVAATTTGQRLWTAGIALVLLALVFALVLTALYSFGAMRVRPWTYPKPEDVFDRVGATKTNRDLDLAADLYYSFGRNEAVTRNQVAYLAASGKWLGIGLSLLVLLAGVLVAYSVFTPSGSTKLSCSLVHHEHGRPRTSQLSCRLTPG